MLRANLFVSLAAFVVADTRQADTTLSCDASDSYCHPKSSKVLLQRDAQGVSTKELRSSVEVAPHAHDDPTMTDDDIKEIVTKLDSGGEEGSLSSGCLLFVHMLEEGWCGPDSIHYTKETNLEAALEDCSTMLEVEYEDGGEVINAGESPEAQTKLQQCQDEARAEHERTKSKLVEGTDEEKNLGFACQWQQCDVSAMKQHHGLKLLMARGFAAPSTTTTATHPPDGSSTHCQPISGGPAIRTRSEIHMYTDDDFKKFEDAVRKFHDIGEVKNGGKGEDSTDYPNSWQAIASIHKYGHPPFTNPEPGFVFFHRVMLFDLETQLQKAANDCNITLPFWNANLEQQPMESIVFSANRYGGTGGMLDGAAASEGGQPCSKCKGSKDESFCLTDGLAANWKVDDKDLVLGGGKGKHPTNGRDRDAADSCCRCVFRSPTETPGARATDWATVLAYISGDEDFEVFVKRIDAVHNHVHVRTTAGNMAYFPASARDPIFYLHHAHIDRIFWCWQKFWANHKGVTFSSTLKQPERLINFFGKLPDADGAVDYTKEHSLQDPAATFGEWIGEWDLENECLKLPKSNPVACIKNVPRR
jgi:hypothetical protein